MDMDDFGPGGKRIQTGVTAIVDVDLSCIESRAIITKCSNNDVIITVAVYIASRISGMSKHIPCTFADSSKGRRHVYAVITSMIDIGLSYALANSIIMA
jgi:hypothetical protein